LARKKLEACRCLAQVAAISGFINLLSKNGTNRNLSSVVHPGQIVTKIGHNTVTADLLTATGSPIF
jgi:hypothetical protein